MDASNLLEQVDFRRLDAARGLNTERKSDLGQFMTPAPVARLMAQMALGKQKHVKVLDAGAGVGTLFTALVAELCKKKPERIDITAYEIDPHLSQYIPDTFEICRRECETHGIAFHGELIEGDFLKAIADQSQRVPDI